VQAVTVGGDGRWQSSVRIGADAHWYHVEARLAGAPGQIRTTTNTMGGGDVVAYFGQSELERLNSPYKDTAPRPALPDGDQVQFTYVREPRGAVNHNFVTPSAALPTPIDALAKFWIDNAPAGRKVHFVDLAHSGTSHLQLADDGNPKRNWSDLETTVNSLRADGTDIGLVLESWFAGDRATGTQWNEAFAPMYTGLAADGTPFATGGTTTRNAAVDNFLWDLSGQDRGLFDEDTTKLGIFGPHRFEGVVTDPRVSAYENADGSTAFGLRAIDRARIGAEAFLDNPAVQKISVAPVLPVPLDYSNGYLDESGQWVDTAHPSSGTPDGAQRLAKHVANAALVALGHVSAETPVFDIVRWTPDYVEVGSTGGRITTARIVRGMDPLGEGQPHWTDVLGFEVNGLAAERAEITEDGMIRIFPLAGALFGVDDFIDFGRGGANGFLTPLEDWLAQAYLNLPIIDRGLIGLEGVGVRPTPGAERFRSTLPAAGPLPLSGALLAGALGGMALLRRRA
jgi:hypothetical protein